MLTRKLIFNAFRLNFFLKKFISSKLHEKAIVKFTQPTRLLISNKKSSAVGLKNHYLHRYQKSDTYKRILPLITLLTHYLQPQALTDQIAYELEKTTRHWPLLKSIRSMIKQLRPKMAVGYRIAIRGKINASDRTRTFYIKQGKIPIKTFSSRIHFSMCQSKARTGSFGIKS